MIAGSGATPGLEAGRSLRWAVPLMIDSDTARAHVPQRRPVRDTAGGAALSPIDWPGRAGRRSVSGTGRTRHVVLVLWVSPLAR